MSADIAALIRSVAAAGGRLYAKAEYLRVEAAKPLPSDLIAKLKAHKGELLKALESEPSELDENAREHFAERAAIGEYDGGLLRSKAEAQAARRVFEYRLSDDPERWLLLLAAPGDDLAKVKRCLQLRDDKRVLNVQRYRVMEGSIARQEAC